MEEPEKKVETPPVIPAKRSVGMPAKIIGIVVLCMVSSALTAWLLLGTGVIKPDASQTIDANREKIVLQQGEIVADVFKKVSPSTVSITTESVSDVRRYFGADSSVEQGAGSGIIISADGYVLTNKHVVPAGASKLTVVLADGTTYDDVTVVGRDPLNDIAFLKINGAKNLPAVELGDSDAVQPGQQVVAIGNALGEFRNSVTSGIISGKGRPIQAADGSGASEQLENLLQTDAAINPGNSGGPLVTLDGKVVGINTAISEEGQAVGFAIPINDAKGLVNSILKQGKIIRPYLGVRYVGLDKATAEQLKLSVSQGSYVTGDASSPAVVSGSPADKAGLKSGDVITKVNDTQITEEHSLASILAQYSPGDKITLTILRDGKSQTLTATLDPYPGS
ncbi:MAG TPA: trypsin-like peptidase domain-containing protein [Candidatus Saccharimonadales bacterium]|nr:trypsin-like peptidase domain-containing protein [Candidatus Saccharimonadales bacterium]